MLTSPLLLLVIGILAVVLAASRGGRRRARTVSAGRALLEAGRIEEAREVFEQLARQASPAAPGREAALYWLGQTLEASQQQDAARRVYLRYLADYGLPRSPARANPELLERVRAALRALVMDAPQGAGPWEQFRRGETSLQLGLIGARRLLRDGDLARAEFVLLRLQQSASPSSEEGVRVRMLLGLVQEAQGQVPAAVRTLEGLLARGGALDARQRQRLETRLVRLRQRGGAATAWERFQSVAEFLDGEAPGLPATAPAPETAAALEPQPQVPAAAPAPTLAPGPLAAEDAEALTRGLRVGPYVLAEKLGEGGFGEVFRALRPVALKFARTPAAVERLRQLARLQGQVRSERVVAPLEVALEHDPPYLVLELVDGPSLRDVLRAKGRLEARLALTILLEVARGLEDAHRAGVLHLDLKPENVLVDLASGAVKLTDFELGRLASGEDGVRPSLSFASEPALAGTLAYMAPEQRAGQPTDARSDLYTFGVILFELLTGTLPEPGDSVSAFVSGLPPAIDAVFSRCFVRRERRFASAEELVRELERVQAALPAEDVRRALAEVPRRVREQRELPRALRELADRASPQLAAAETPAAAEPPQPADAVAEAPAPAEPAPVAAAGRPALDRLLPEREPGTPALARPELEAFLEAGRATDPPPREDDTEPRAGARERPELA